MGWGPLHFGYTNITQGITLGDLRKRWEGERDKRDKQGSNRLKSTPWTQVIIDELWRIITSRPTKLTWEPFLSLMEGASNLWFYPIVQTYRTHSNGSYEFDLIVIQSLKPQDKDISTAAI